MFGRRSDATLVRGATPMRRIMPFISPRRNDSVFHYAQEIDVGPALDFLEKRNAERPADRPITLFHLVLRCLSQALELRPGINRFVKGGRLWQRDGVYLTFSAKRELVDGAPLLTIKRRFEPATESLDAMVDGVYDQLRPARAGVQSTSDRETSLLLRLPSALTGLLVRLNDWADALGLLPRGMLEADPLCSSMFVANLGSVGLREGYHHLWEHGTCSIFCVIGRVSADGGSRRMTLCWTYDERMEDGLYAYFTLEGMRERLEEPTRLLASTAELAAR